MNFEIKKENWNDFLSSVSKRRYEWTTQIEVISTELGDQILTNGLPLNGITAENRSGPPSIVISVGEDTDLHHTHTIASPARIAFLSSTDDHGDVIDIEEEDGTKTLITLIEPMGILVGYSELDVAMAAG